MAQKTGALKLGIFVFIGFALIVTAIFLIGNKESMFSKTLNIHAYFKSIEGLRRGSPVRLSGIDVGTVNGIQIVANEKGQVEITIRLKQEMQKFITTNTRATIETEGLVGNKVITLVLSKETAPQIEDGGTIIGVDPFAFGAIIQEVEGTVNNIKDLSKSMASVIAKIDNGHGSLGKLVNSDDLYNNTNSLIKTADKSLVSISNKLDTVSIVINSLLTGVQSIVSNVDTVVSDIDKIINNIKSGKGLLGNLLKDKSPLDTTVHRTVDNLLAISETTKIGAIKFEENMEALKRNWLFKSYFEQRGYYDKPGYEKQLDTYLNQVNERIKLLDDRIEILKKMQKKQ